MSVRNAKAANVFNLTGRFYFSPPRCGGTATAPGRGFTYGTCRDITNEENIGHLNSVVAIEACELPNKLEGGVP